MNRKYIAYSVLGAISIIGWNLFLIQRDDKMFKAWYHETAKQEYCKTVPQTHPDCNLK